MAKSRVETTIELVKRNEKREERSLFDAADAAQKQIEGDSAKKEEPAAEEAKPEPAKTE